MLVLGVIFVALSLTALVIALVGGSDQSVDFDMALVEGQISATGVFLLGAATVLLFVIGLELLRSGARRARRRRKEQKELDRISERLHTREEHTHSGEQAEVQPPASEHRGSRTTDPE